MATRSPSLSYSENTERTSETRQVGAGTVGRDDRATLVATVEAVLVDVVSNHLAPDGSHIRMLRLPIESVSRSGPVTNLGRRVAKYAGVEDAMENDHWIVDDFGMHSEMRDGTFEIEAHRLAELTSVEERDILNWPVYIASETRFDIERFLEAYQGALVKHAGRYGTVMDPLLLAESAETARNIWGERPVCG